MMNKMNFKSYFSFTTIRSRLIVSIALVHLVMMTIFVFDLVERQRIFLLNNNLENITGFATTLAANSSSWVLANDLVGLSELLESTKHLSGLRYAMITTLDGRVVSHTDHTKNGLYLKDVISRSLLNAAPKVNIMFVNDNFIDIAVPITTIHDEHIGWTRVGAGREQIIMNLHLVTRNGILYTILAIVIGSFFAVMIGRRLTRRLEILLTAFDKIRSGNHSLRIKISTEDEVAKLSEEFNRMLDVLFSTTEKLSKTEETFRLIFENSPTGKLITGIDGSLRINRACRDILGYGQDEIRSEYWLDITHPDDIQKGKKIFESLKTGKISYANYEQKYLRKDGGIVHADVYTALQRDISGNPLFYITMFRDITESKRIKMELEDTANRYRQITESLPLLIWTSLPNGQCDYLSRQWVEYTGVPEEDQLGDKWLDRIHPDDIETTKAVWDDCLTNYNDFNTEFRIQRADGAFHWFKTRAVKIRDSAGLLVKWFGTNTDIDDLKHAESELIQHRDHLEMLVEDRTAELKRSNLVLQQALAEVKTLSGFIPICAKCKKIRNDLGYWEAVDAYVSQRTGAQFSHSICQDCARELYPELYGSDKEVPHDRLDPRNKSILIVNNDRYSRKILVDALKDEKFKVVQVDNVEEAIIKSMIYKFSVVIIYLVAPRVDTMEFVNEIRRNHPDFKLITIFGGSAENQDKYLKIAKEFGAFKMFTSQVNVDEFKSAVKAAVNL